MLVVRRLHRIDRRWRPIVALSILLMSGVVFYHAFTVPCGCNIAVGSGKLIKNAASQLTGPTIIPIPAINYNLAVNFSAKGALSANNPINVRAIVYNVNLNATNSTELLSYFDKISFTGVRFLNDTTGGDAKISLHYIGNGKYLATGTLVWPEAGGTWPYIIAKGPAYTEFYEKVQVGTPILTVSDVADTLSVNTNATTLFLTWVLVGFSVLMLQPILDAVLVRDRDDRNER